MHRNVSYSKYLSNIKDSKAMAMLDMEPKTDVETKVVDIPEMGSVWVTDLGFMACIGEVVAA